MIDHLMKKIDELRKKGVTTLSEIEKIAMISSVGNPLDCMEESKILKLGHISFEYETRRNFIEGIEIIFEAIAENKIQITRIERF